uniref:Uncharacterized protein n=1 Tax=Arundo donax TaxID=35708 RepID=A0A0A8YW69_ARUDO
MTISHSWRVRSDFTSVTLRVGVAESEEWNLQSWCVLRAVSFLSV